MNVLPIYTELPQEFSYVRWAPSKYSRTLVHCFSAVMKKTLCSVQPSGHIVTLATPPDAGHFCCNCRVSIHRMLTRREKKQREGI